MLYGKSRDFPCSCGYDCSSRLIDVDKGLETRVFKEDQVVGVVKFHPTNSNRFLSGGSKGLLRLWDIRTGKAVHQYLRGLGPILDVEFTNDTRQFISSSDVSKGNVSENLIIVWDDVSRQVPLSNQIYVEAYTCPCVRCHPSDPYFVAQTGTTLQFSQSSPPSGLISTKDMKATAFPDFPSSAISVWMVKNLSQAHQTDPSTCIAPKHASSSRKSRHMSKHMHKCCFPSSHSQRDSFL